MLQSIVDYRLDAAAVAIFVLATMGAVRLYLRHKHQIRRTPHRAWLGVILILIAGTWAAELAPAAMPTHFTNLPPGSDSRLLAMVLSRADMLGSAGLLAMLVISAVAIFSQRGRDDGTSSPLRTLIDLQPECVQILSTSGFILDINPAGCDLFEIEELKEGRRLSFIPYVAFDDRAKFTGMLESVSHGHAASLQFSAVSHFGEPRWIDARLMPLRDAAGNVVAAFSVMRDLTALREVQRERDSLLRELEALSRRPNISDVTANVLLDLGQALETLNAVADTVADKLRTSPVTDMESFIAGQQNEMLEELTQLSRGVDQIKHIVATHRALTAMTQEETFKLQDVIEEAIATSTPALAENKIKLDRRYSASPTVTLHRHKVLQILATLLTNAEQAEATEISIDLEYTSELRVARIRIADNGVGIPQDHLDHLFSADFTALGEGYGFGLHASAAAARVMGGSLRVTSDGPGRGAAFTLELPIAATATQPPRHLQEVS